jgi:EAL and modified HD-GYP domain-containing signal transduction protein
MDIFIARQPIFDAHQKVFGYELLFRSGLDNLFMHPDPNQATSRVIADSFFLLGISELTGGKRAFINVTREVLLKEYLYLVPKDLIVAEILETVAPDPEIIAACKKLKGAGYLLALDDFIYKDEYRSLVELSDFIKVDVLSTDEEAQRSLAKEFAPRGIRLLAEKVETTHVHQGALKMGYTYFQGYFFSKPRIISGKDIPGYKLHYLRLLREIHRREADLKQMGQIIRQEVSLSFKLLRYINSAFFGLRNEISSVMQALALLGEKEIRKWVSLIAMAHMGEDKPEELLVHAVTRAKFCESLAGCTDLAGRKEDLFLMGMFSLLDAILDRSLVDILREIPIAEDIKAALLGEENPLKTVYELALSCESGQWEKFSGLARRLRVDEVVSSRLYLDAVKWGHECFRGTD